MGFDVFCFRSSQLHCKMIQDHRGFSSTTLLVTYHFSLSLLYPISNITSDYWWAHHSCCQSSLAKAEGTCHDAKHWTTLVVFINASNLDAGCWGGQGFCQTDQRKLLVLETGGNIYKYKIIAFIYNYRLGSIQYLPRKYTKSRPFLGGEMKHVTFGAPLPCWTYCCWTMVTTLTSIMCSLTIHILS